MTTALVSEEAEMDLELSSGVGVPNFEFAFNSAVFSNMVMKIEVVTGGDVSGGSLICNGNKKADNGEIDCFSTMASTPILTVKTLHINSAILAARSRFFLKLFSNGMNESDQTHPRIRIADSEENAFMELLSFMYSGKLTTIEPTLLLDILMASDKFEVLSCMRYCSQLLRSLPMTTESALLYLDHPCSLSMAVEVQGVVGAAREFLAEKYKILDKFEELMNISLSGIEVIFSSTDIQVASEDAVYNFLLEWARARYLEPEERREILSSRLLPLVSFSHMTCAALQEILASTDDDIDREQVTKRINEVLLHKAYPTQMEGALAADASTLNWQSAERTYGSKHVKAVAFDRPYPQVIVYMDLKRDECSQFFPSGVILSDWFHLAGQKFYLMANCVLDEQTELYSFGLWLGIYGNSISGSLCFDIEFAARTRSSGKFLSKYGGRHTFSGPLLEGCDDLFGVPWSTFIADDSLFIDGVLHLRVDLTAVE
ncbi:unnamed protein product [Triticum turgidum subsp. durum]|uniref:BTB domain-containing protein n=2 Tax=Triticum TaxID=4564 RepID=A0A9R1QBS6_TRITD|nr:unnamed protein product [Triticum turgidum subsp. durum]